MTLCLKPILEDEVYTNNESETDHILSNNDYKPFCGFRSFEIARGYLFGKYCSSLCNESCLFCLTKNTLEEFDSNYNTHWYRFTNKSCQSIIQLKIDESFVILMISRDSLGQNFSDDDDDQSINDEPIYLIRL